MELKILVTNFKGNQEKIFTHSFFRNNFGFEKCFTFKSRQINTWKRGRTSAISWI